MWIEDSRHMLQVLITGYTWGMAFWCIDTTIISLLRKCYHMGPMACAWNQKFFHTNHHILFNNLVTCTLLSWFHRWGDSGSKNLSGHISRNWNNQEQVRSLSKILLLTIRQYMFISNINVVKAGHSHFFLISSLYSTEFNDLLFVTLTKIIISWYSSFFLTLFYILP